LPLGFKTRLMPRIAYTSSGIVQSVKVLTTVSMSPSCKGMRSPGKSRKFDVEPRLASLPFCQTDHSLVWFQRKKLAHLLWIVVRKVHARTDSDFEDFTLSRRHNPLTNPLDWLGITQNAYELG